MPQMAIALLMSLFQAFEVSKDAINSVSTGKIMARFPTQYSTSASVAWISTKLVWRFANCQIIPVWQQKIWTIGWA